jgi:hypothetical protein
MLLMLLWVAMMTIENRSAEVEHLSGREQTNMNLSNVQLPLELL